MSTTRPTTTRAVHLASRPHGAPTEDNFRIEEISLPELSDGQILVANDVMSVDPYMRGRMNDVKSYVPPFHIDRPLDGGAVGTVIESRSGRAPGNAEWASLRGPAHSGENLVDRRGIEPLTSALRTLRSPS